MPETLRKRDRFLFGIVLPLAVMCAGLLLIMSMPTAAGAAEFAALGILLGAITILPIVLIVNLLLVTAAVDTRATCFKRGMIAPGIVLFGALLYQAGLLDALG